MTLTPRVETIDPAIGGVAFHQVFLVSDETGARLFTGFTLRGDELTDDEVLRIYEASPIILEDTLSYSGNYMFSDLPLNELIEMGATTVVCEYNEGADDMENLVRVVRKDYDFAASYEGYTVIKRDEYELPDEATWRGDQE